MATAPYTDRVSRGNLADQVVRNEAATTATKVNIPNDEVYDFGTATDGVYSCRTGTAAAFFVVSGSGTSLIAGSSFWTATKDTAVKFNFYVEGGNLKCQNKFTGGDFIFSKIVD